MFVYNTKNHYKIWFSNNPDVFLDIENQLRFIRIITRNPNLKFSFVYSSRCLSGSALAELKIFCEKHNITALDFDKDISDLIRDADDIDKTFYSFAKIEIENTLLNQGGNFASASDFVRVLKPVIEACGFYEDFELDIDYSNVPEIIHADAPVLIKVTGLDNISLPSINNDRLAFAVKNENRFQLADEAVEWLRRAQRTVIENYNNPKDSILIGWHKDYANQYNTECGFSYFLVQGYFSQFPNATSLQWRKFIQDSSFSDILNLLPVRTYAHYTGAQSRGALPLEKIKLNFGNYLLKESPAFYKSFEAKDPIDLAEKVICRFIRNRLLVWSVMSVSGAPTLFSAFNFPHKFTRENFCTFVERIALSDIKKYLPNVYIDKQVVELSNPLKALVSRPSFDLSWTNEGAQGKNLRIEKMIAAQKVIKAAWCMFHRKTESPKPQLLAIPEHTKLDLLVNKYKLPDCSQVSLQKGLRNAAANNKVVDLAILIRHVEDINAQDTNPRQQQTALHWAAIKGNTACYDLLIEANAKDDVPNADGQIARNLKHSPNPQ